MFLHTQHGACTPCNPCSPAPAHRARSSRPPTRLVALLVTLAAASPASLAPLAPLASLAPLAPFLAPLALFLPFGPSLASASPAPRGRGLGYDGGGPGSPGTPLSCPLLRLYSASGPLPMVAGAQNQTDWGSNGTNSRFIAGPCLQVSGIHSAQGMSKRVAITDWTLKVNPRLTFPGTRRLAFAVDLDLASGQQRPLDVVRESYCSAGAFLPNGTMVAIGGGKGRGKDTFSIRALGPCDPAATSCTWTIVGTMASKRWYPSTQILPEGRVLIVGGARTGSPTNSPSINNPTLEYWPRRSAGPALVTLEFLGRQSLPYNYYPFLHLLPSGRVFIFAGKSYILFDTTTNAVVPGTYPPLAKTDRRGRFIFRNHPLPGTSALLPLSSNASYSAEIIICGGSVVVNGKARAKPTAADDKCWRVRPEDPSPQWAMERMCGDYPQCKKPMPRMMGDAVLLADGTMLIINGAGGTRSSNVNSAANPVLTPLLFSPYTRTWNGVRLASSFVPRLYHSTALLLHDGTVLVGGSNPNPRFNTNNLFYPSEGRTEVFVPPYFYLGTPSPVLSYAPATVPISSLFPICFSAASITVDPSSNSSSNSNSNSSNSSNLTGDGGDASSDSRFRVVLSHPGLSSHGQRHNMRHVDLDIQQLLDTGEGTWAATVLSPPSLSIAPPTFYWLFVLDRGVPNTEGVPVTITPPDPSGAQGGLPTGTEPSAALCASSSSSSGGAGTAKARGMRRRRMDRSGEDVALESGK